MEKPSFALAAAAAVMIISACGSASGTSTNAPTHTTKTAPTPASRTSAARQLEAQAQHLISRWATLSGQLVSSNRPSQQQARDQLAQLQRQLQAVSTQASRQLAGNDPARRIIVQSTQRAARAAKALEREMQSAGTQTTLTQLQNTLAGLSSDIGHLRAGVTPASTSKVLDGLQALEQQLMAGSQ
jgi:hypothetical protein